MPEYFTHNTVMATFWCAKCGKPTPHDVASGRRGVCLTCRDKPLPVQPPPPPKQGELF